ncbi:Protein of unknown function [Bacillus mobilis]|nr:Protein of unknown function [Bacillus mobilis]
MDCIDVLLKACIVSFGGF